MNKQNVILAVGGCSELIVGWLTSFGTISEKPGTFGKSSNRLLGSEAHANLGFPLCGSYLLTTSHNPSEKDKMT